MTTPPDSAARVPLEAMRDPPAVALTIAGSDSGGGAGLQADLKVFQAFGVFGTSVVTAVTAQNTLGVSAIHVLSPEIIRAQLRAVLDDLAPAAAKTGMLADASTVRAIAAELDPELLLVVDPVMVATSGDRLLDASAEGVLRDELLPLAALVMPNIPEAEALTGLDIRNETDMRRAAELLVSSGAGAALVKGGHLEGDEVVDVLYANGEAAVWRGRRYDVGALHGSGCTLSAAVTAGLALGRPLFEAVDAAVEFTRRAIRSAAPLGAGALPLDHRVRP